MARKWSGPGGGGIPRHRPSAGVSRDEAKKGTTAAPGTIGHAARWVAFRCDLTPDRAALVAALVGLGAALGPMLPALVTGMGR